MRQVREDIPAGSSTCDSFPIDGDPHASVYAMDLMARFTELGSSAKDMFMHIVTHIGYETDVIELREIDYCSDRGISRPTFFRAKQELIEWLILPRSARKNTYWVNPSYIFRGNRLKKYPDNIKIPENPLVTLKRERAGAVITED
jgi:hypothetical protein